MGRVETFFITGVNGAGKTTLASLLKKILPKNYQIHDFDERGVPNNVNALWRRRTTRYWLERARDNAKSNVTTVISGLSKPHEIFHATTKRNQRKIRIAFLDVSSKQINKRLHRRYATPAKIRKLKAVTGLSLKDCITANIQHARELRQECKKYRCITFNTTTAKPSRTADKVAIWIIHQSQN